jgi:hypothetical protein
MLRRHERAAHPPDATLVAFEADPGSVSAEDRDSVRVHLDSCAACRDALTAVGSFDLESLGEGAGSSFEEENPGPLERLLAWVRLFPQPALAAAALALVAIPLGLTIWSRVGSETPTAPPGSGPASDMVAAAEDPTLEGPAPEPPLHEEPPPAPDEEIARALSGEAKAPAAVVVASLTPESPLVYTPPSDSEYTGLGRFPQGRRSAGSAPPPLALAPDHGGLTVKGSPTLYWFMPASTDHRIEFVLMAPDVIDPVLMVTTKAPIEPGFHAVPLGEHGVTLEPYLTYRWSVALVLDESQRHKDVIAGGAIARIGSSPTLRGDLEKAGSAMAGHMYAAHGLWYDAVDSVSRRILERPGEPSVRSRRAELLEQAGLQAAADYDRQAIGAD